MGFVTYNLIKVDMELGRYARLLCDRNVGTLLHRYKYICVLWQALNS